MMILDVFEWITLHECFPSLNMFPEKKPSESFAFWRKTQIKIRSHSYWISLIVLLSKFKDNLLKDY